MDLKKKLRNFVVKNSSTLHFLPSKKSLHFVGLAKEKPGIAFLVVNDRPDAHLYMKQNIETWNYLGFNFFKYHYTPAVDEQTLIEKIQELNEREDVHGIMIQVEIFHVISGLFIFTATFAREIVAFYSEYFE